MKLFNDLASLLIAMSLGIMLAERFQIHRDDLFYLGILILILTPKTKWVPPWCVLNKADSKS